MISALRSLLGLFVVSVIVSGNDVEMLKPPAKDKAGSARWVLSQSSWGVLATTSLQSRAPFGNPISVAELRGTPYFYVSMLDASIQDLQVDPECTLSISEAAIDCTTLKLDAEDPRCIRVALSGSMINVTDPAEKEEAKSTLFSQHHAMKSWPSDHSWLIQKLHIMDLWVVDTFGGAANVSTADYFAAPEPARGEPRTTAHNPMHKKPLFWKKAANARWLVHEADWATLATKSVHLNNRVFANPRSFVDGTLENATGVPYFLMSSLDASTQDLLHNDTCTLTLSQAEINCFEHGMTGAYDAEDPRCTRLSLTGRMEGVKDPQEKLFAERALVSRHPVMKQWLDLGDFHVVKLNIEMIWLINMFGGASIIDVQEYFKTSIDTTPVASAFVI